jgi:H+/gluconate symporter-like permease
MWIDLYHLTVLFGCMALLMTLVIRGKSIFVIAPLCALLAATLSGVDPLVQMNEAYMTGFADYVKRFYLMFALGAVFGKLMDQSGAAVTIAQAVGHRLGTERACLAVVLSAAVLTYGGVSLFVVGFSVYPLAVQLFRKANLPRELIPAAIGFGSATFTMTSAGSPEIQNLIPIKYLINSATGLPLTDARAGWPVSLIVALFMFCSGQWYLERTLRHKVKAGIGFVPRPTDRPETTSEAGSLAAPSIWLALVPLLVTLLSLNILPWLCHSIAATCIPTGRMVLLERILSQFPEDGTLTIFLGVLAAVVVFRQRLRDVWSCFGEGFSHGLIAVASTSAMVGFGAAIKTLPAFGLVVNWVTHLPGDPLLSAAIAVAVIAAIAGSASGGQGIAFPIIKPIYIDQLGVAPRALHRVVAISSGTLDSLPANGYVVMLIHNICGETHARAYGPIFVTTVLIPAIGALMAIGLFKLVPQWALM